MVGGRGLSSLCWDLQRLGAGGYWEPSAAGVAVTGRHALTLARPAAGDMPSRACGRGHPQLGRGRRRDWEGGGKASNANQREAPQSATWNSTVSPVPETKTSIIALLCFGKESQEATIQESLVCGGEGRARGSHILPQSDSESLLFFAMRSRRLTDTPRAKRPGADGHPIAPVARIPWLSTPGCRG